MNNFNQRDFNVRFHIIKKFLILFRNVHNINQEFMIMYNNNNNDSYHVYPNIVHEFTTILLLTFVQ